MAQDSLSYWLTDTTESGRRWRSILLFGSNTATYKFALGGALLEVARSGNDQITLADLAVPFTDKMCRHIELETREATNPSSAFLNACRAYNSNSIEHDELIAVTMSQGFRYVLDAFHRVVGVSVEPFYGIEGTGDRRKIILTTDLLSMDVRLTDLLDQELEARWRLVESAWTTGVSASMLDVEYDRNTETLLVIKSGSNHRKAVGRAKWALSGYQDGRCFYCGVVLDSESLNRSGPTKTNVDHVIPFRMNNQLKVLDQVWNLVNSCFECNSSKSGQVPTLEILERVSERNEYYINSNHPLKEAIIRSTGNSQKNRVDFINALHVKASELLKPTWDGS